MKVRWTRLALDDLEWAYAYISEGNPSRAAAMVRRILAAVEQLRLFPGMGRPGRVQGTRELVVAGTPFIVAYRLKEDAVEVLAVVHGSRMWPEEFQ